MKNPKAWQCKDCKETFYSTGKARKHAKKENHTQFKRVRITTTKISKAEKTQLRERLETAGVRVSDTPRFIATECRNCHIIFGWYPNDPDYLCAECKKTSDIHVLSEN
jgi:hypothetical protein